LSRGETDQQTHREAAPLRGATSDTDEKRELAPLRGATSDTDEKGEPAPLRGARHRHCGEGEKEGTLEITERIRNRTLIKCHLMAFKSLVTIREKNNASKERIKVEVSALEP
jgi:hypothetical protein